MQDNIKQFTYSVSRNGGVVVKDYYFDFFVSPFAFTGNAAIYMFFVFHIFLTIKIKQPFFFRHSLIYT